MCCPLTIRERVERPDQRTSIGTQRDDAKRGRAGIHDAVDDDGRRLDLGVVTSVASMIRPGNLQPRNVGAVYLVEIGVASSSWIAASGSPISVCVRNGPRSRRCAGEGGNEENSGARLLPPGQTLVAVIERRRPHCAMVTTTESISVARKPAIELVDERPYERNLEQPGDQAALG